MAINQKKRGFALLIAVIFMSVMLAFGLALGSLAYKQQVLASTSLESQYAFYAADAALECALYFDQQQSLFTVTNWSSASPPSSSPPPITCDGKSPSTSSQSYVQNSSWIINYRLPLASNKRCAYITVYKYASVVNGSTTYIFSQGYDVSCNNVTASSGRFASRGLQIHY